MKKAILAVLVIGGAASAAAQPGALPVGNWSQTSAGQELVLVPRVKLSPNVGISTGTSLGGSVGYGSMTRTEIVAEPMLMDVAREMSLRIGADGDFTWVTVKRHADGSDCVRTTQEEKHGQVRLAGSRLLFTVAGGSENYERSCGGVGSSALPAGEEVYEMTGKGGGLQLRSGPSIWTFSRS